MEIRAFRLAARAALGDRLSLTSARAQCGMGSAVRGERLLPVKLFYESEG
jgi:hypothetical protein